MTKTLEKLLTLAGSQVGYTEKNDDRTLDEMVGANAGSGNHTKYARDLTAAGLPGYCGSAWCAVYQMWLELQTTGREQALKNMGSQFYNCFAVRDYAKSRGRWVDKKGDPIPGDLVIFRQSHVGRVVRVTDERIYTNEGNTSNGTAVVRNGGMVCEKNYTRSSGSILGYVRMEYPDSIKSGWQQEDGGRRFYLAADRYVKNDWYQDGGKWYWFNGYGISITEEWYLYKDRWYYFDAKGEMVTGLQVISGEIFAFSKDGAMLTGEVRLHTDERGALQM